MSRIADALLDLPTFAFGAVIVLGTLGLVAVYLAVLTVIFTSLAPHR